MLFLLAHWFFQCNKSCCLKSGSKIGLYCCKQFVWLPGWNLRNWLTYLNSIECICLFDIRSLNRTRRYRICMHRSRSVWFFCFAFEWRISAWNHLENIYFVLKINFFSVYASISSLLVLQIPEAQDWTVEFIWHL